MALQQRLYATWYEDPTTLRDPAADTLLFRPLDALVNPLTPAAILTSVATGTDQALAFAILGADNLIHVVHRITRYVPPLGQPRLPYDNINLATFGEVSAMGATTIEVPPTFFTCTAALPNVLTIAATTTSTAADPAISQVAHHAGVPANDITEVRTRKATLIPAELVANILRASAMVGGLTPCALWTNHVEPSLAQPIFPADFAPFVDWARVAYSGGVNGANPIQIAPTPPPRHLEPPLAAQRYALLTRDLPVSAAPPPSVDGNLLATAIGEFRAEFAAREDSKVLRAALKRAAEQRPSSRWFASTTRLLRLCQVQDEAELPPMWHAMASHGVKLDRNTIQYHLSLDMPNLDTTSAPGTASVCSPELSKALGQLTFQTTPDDIQAGIHIFAVCYPTQASHSAANRVAGLYDEKVQSVTGMTLDETVTLQAAQTFLLPVGYVELQLVVCGYHRFLAAILGPQHALVTAMGEFIAGLKVEMPALHSYFGDSVSRTTGLLRYIQLSMYSWIRRQLLTNTALDPPKFVEVFEKIERQEWVVPTLPFPHSTPPPSDTPPAPGGPPPGSNPTASPNKKGITVATPQNHLDPLVPVNKAFDPKAFIRLHGAPPNNDKGGAMCLLYHVRGQCKQDCERGPLQGIKSDHRRHNKPETERLVAYLNKAT